MFNFAKSLVCAMLLLTLVLGGASCVAEQPPAPIFEAELELWHPGVIGYDAQYTIHTYLGDRYLAHKNVEYVCDDPDVTFLGNKVVVPYATRLQKDQITVTVTDKTTGQSKTIAIACHRWEEETFSDEFEGDVLDKTKWDAFEWGTHNTVSVRGKDNMSVGDGKLSLWIRKEPATVTGSDRVYDYTDAGVSTMGKFMQRYGLFVCSMKCPTQTSVNSAFWMIPPGAYSKVYMFYNAQNPTAGCSEIDFIEYSAHWGNIYSLCEHFYDTANNGAHTAKSMTAELDFSPTEQYAEYACAWLEDGLYYYCNGDLVFSTSNTLDKGGDGSLKGRPGYVILTLGMYPPENTWCGPFQFTDEDFPIELSVDYVRVYK